MKFVHAADLHLDSPLRGLERYEGAPVDELRGATRRALENLVALCLDEAADFLLIAGDLYDGDWQDYNTGLFFSKQMSRLREAGIPVFVIRGNHDAESKLTRNLQPPDNVTIFGTRKAETHTLAALGVAIHGRSFASGEVTEDMSATYPAPVRGHFNIGLLHTSADGFHAHKTYAPCSVADLMAKGYEYWALGHVHERAVRHREPWVVFSGNVQGRHIRETGPRGAAVVTVEDGRVSAFDERPLDVVRWSLCEIDAAGAATPGAVADRVRQRLETELDAAGDRLIAARVVLRGACDAHAALASEPAEFTAQVRVIGSDLGRVWIEQVRIETRSALRLDELAQRDDPLGQLIASTRELRTDANALAALGVDFDALRQKLPPELWSELNLDAPEQLAALIADAEQILLPRLLEHVAEA
jgi:DNA repair protein SbcD/Mre11